MSIDMMYQALEKKFGPDVLAHIQNGDEEKNEALNKIVKKFFLTAKETPEGEVVVEFKAKPFAWGLVHFFRKMFGKSTRESTQLQKAVNQMRQIYGKPLEGTEKERVVKDVINAIILNTDSGKPLTVKVAKFASQQIGSPLLDRCRGRLDQAMRSSYAPAFASFEEMLNDPKADLEQIYEQIEYVERECKKIIRVTDKISEARSELDRMPESSERNNRRVGLTLKALALQEHMEGHTFEEAEDTIENANRDIASAKAFIKPEAKVWEEHAVKARTPLEKYTELVSEQKGNPISFGIQSLKMCFQMLEAGVTAENRKEVEKIEKALVDKLIVYEKNLYEKHESYRRDEMAGGLAQIAGRRKAFEEGASTEDTKKTRSQVPLLTKASGIEFPELRKQAFEILKIALPISYEEAKTVVANFDKIVKDKEKAFEALYATVLTKRKEQAQVREQEMSKAKALQQIYTQFEQKAIKDIDALKKNGPEARLRELVIKALKFELQSLKRIQSEDELNARIITLTSTIASLKDDLMKHAHTVLAEISPKMHADALATTRRIYEKEFKAYPFLHALHAEAEKPVEYTAPKQLTGIQLRAQRYGNNAKDPIEEALEPHEMGITRVSNVEREAKAVRTRLAEMQELHVLLKNRVEELLKVAKDDNLQELIKTVQTRFPLLLPEDFEANEIEEFTDEIAIEFEPRGETKAQFYDETQQIINGYNYLLKEGLKLLTPSPKKNVASILKEMKDIDPWDWSKEDDYKALTDLISANPQDPSLKAKIENILNFCTTEEGLDESDAKRIKTLLTELLKLYP